MKEIYNPWEHGEEPMKTGCTASMQPVRDALHILSGKWKLPIIVALSFGTKRFKEMEREIPGITPKMLSKELHDMELNELVKRTVHDGRPVGVMYELTDYGMTLGPLIHELRVWGLKHRQRLMGVAE